MPPVHPTVRGDFAFAHLDEPILRREGNVLRPDAQRHGPPVRAWDLEPPVGEAGPVRGPVEEIDRWAPEMQPDRAAARPGVHFVRGSGLKDTPPTEQPDAVGQGQRFDRVVGYMEYCEPGLLAKQE